MKNLANCKPSEFLKQTNKIKRSIERWLTVTEIAKIRKTKPDLKVAPDDATPEEVAEVEQENRRRMREQVKDNFSRILDVALDEHADETLEVLALLCFVDPKKVDSYPVSDYLGAVSEMLDNKQVIDFFTSLSRWVQIGTSS